jgi:hypothetical protein
VTSDLLYAKLKLLNERVWENRAPRQKIDSWLDNFSDPATRDSDRLHALYLLSQLTYFGDVELRQMLQGIYRDKFKYPIVAEARKRLGGTTDTAVLAQAFRDELSHTRFLGLGNPAESGTHLLYFFRQENRLKKDYFVHSHELFDRPLTDPAVDIAIPDLRRLVFIDDFCGSGSQARRYSRTVLTSLRDICDRTGKSIRTSYFSLVAVDSGITRVKNEATFDDVDAIFVLDSTYKCFSAESRHFRTPPPGLEQDTAHEMARRYGNYIYPEHPIGFKDGQLLIGFHHNIPDNTLPIVWYEEQDHPDWRSILRRYEKVYE